MQRNLLWIHGWAMSPEAWGDVAAFLPEYRHHFVSFADCRKPDDFYEAIRSKIPGAGKAFGGSSRTVTDEETGFHTERWTLVGWSMGGMLALETFFRAMGYSEAREVGEINADMGKIDSVIVVGSTLCFVDRDRNKGWPRRIVERMRDQLAVRRDETVAEFKKLVRGTETPEDSEPKGQVKEVSEVLKPNDPLEACDFNDDGLRTGLEYLLEADLTEAWRKNVEPASRIMWIHGNQDPICPIGCLPDHTGTNIERRIIPGAGHAPFISHSAEFFRYIRGFLDVH
jgi:pimeloyl-[acyl-carrier protein] methyl ester esterase